MSTEPSYLEAFEQAREQLDHLPDTLRYHDRLHTVTMVREFVGLIGDYLKDRGCVFGKPIANPREMLAYLDKHRLMIDRLRGGRVTAADLQGGIVAAECHDLGYIDMYRHNEPIGAERCFDILVSCGFPGMRAEKDSAPVRETAVYPENGSLVQRPSTFIGRLMCDADLANFGREDGPRSCLAAGDALYEELCIQADREGVPHTPYENFLAFSAGLVAGHAYFTPWAKTRWDVGRRRNAELLKKKLEHRTLEHQLRAA